MMKKLLWTIGAMVVIALAWAASMLLPAHRQIRDLEVKIPTLEAVEAALAATDNASASGPVEIRYVDTASQASPDITVSHTVAVLRWADGRLFLIDTGMNPSAAQEFGRTIELLLGADEVRTFGAVEEQMGDDVQAVRGIGFTHLHIDHASGVTDLCAALDRPAMIYQTQQQATLQNLHTKEGQRLVEGSVCDREVLAGRTLSPIPGFPGLAILAAGGHTPGSTIFLARVADTTWVFSGDLTNSVAEILGDRGKGWIYSYLLVPEDTELLGRWRSWLRSVTRAGARVVVSHDSTSYRSNGLRPWRATGSNERIPPR